MDRTITTELFHQTVHAAVRQRSTRYSDSYNLSIRWERDDTLAHHDVGHPQYLLRTLGLAEAQEVIIAADDATPGWTVEGAFRKILNTAKETNGRALVIVHYAGHGCQEYKTLRLVECARGREFNSMMYLVGMVTPGKGYDLQDQDKVDVLFIFDCSYSFIGYRTPRSGQRIVEVITAADEEILEAFPSCRNSITAKMVKEIKRRQRVGHKYVEFAELIQSLRARSDTVKQPGHGLRLGVRSICLPLAGAATVNPEHIQPALRVVFGIHLADKMTATELNDVVTWMQGLSENVRITVEGVYPASSTLLVVCAPWSVWSKLNGIHGYTFMAEVKGENMMQQLLGCSGSLTSESRKG